MKVLIFLILSLLVITYSRSSFAVCEKEAQAAMAKFGIKQSHLFWIDKRGENNSKAYLYWYETKECGAGGYVCVTANENCYINEVFTRYRCVIPGMSHWN